MRVFAWSNRRTRDLDLLLGSADKQRVQIEVIGLGYEADKGCFFKNDSLEEAIARLADDEIVLCTDGYDVLYLEGTEAIRAKFEALDAPLVVCAERWFSHQIVSYRPWFKQLTPDSPYRFVNAGAVIGRARALREMLATMRDYDRDLPWEPVKGVFSDQTHLSHYLVENPGAIRLDTRCEIFWCLAGEWDNVHETAPIEDGRIRNTATESAPSILHVPWRERYGPVLKSLYERLIEAS